MDPFRAARRPRSDLRQAWFEERRQDAFARAADIRGIGQRRRSRADDLCSAGMVFSQLALRGQLLRREAAESGRGLLVGDVGLASVACKLILGLDQQPL